MLAHGCACIPCNPVPAVPSLSTGTQWMHRQSRWVPIRHSYGCGCKSPNPPRVHSGLCTHRDVILETAAVSMQPPRPNRQQLDRRNRDERNTCPYRQNTAQCKGGLRLVSIQHFQQWQWPVSHVAGYGSFLWTLPYQRMQQ